MEAALSDCVCVCLALKMVSFSIFFQKWVCVLSRVLQREPYSDLYTDCVPTVHQTVYKLSPFNP